MFIFFCVSGLVKVRQEMRRLLALDEDVFLTLSEYLFLIWIWKMSLEHILDFVVC